MPERTNLTRYPFEFTRGAAIAFSNNVAVILLMNFVIELLFHFYMTYDSSTHHLHPSLLQSQLDLSVCTRQYPAFMITTWSFLATGSTWFHSCSNIDNLLLVFRAYSDATAVSAILFYVLILLYFFTSRFMMRSEVFFEEFWGDQRKFSKVHLEAEKDSLRTRQLLRLHESQRELGRSMDDINRREEREARMSNAIERGQSDLRLMTRCTRRIGRSRKAH